MPSIRFETHPQVRVGLVHLDRKRPWPSCINPDTGNEWGVDMKEKMVSVLESLYPDLIRSDHEVKVNDDPSLRKCLSWCRKTGVQVIVAIQPTISDGRLAPVLSQEWGPGLVLWSSPEQQTGSMISGNSLVGGHLMAATLRQLGRRVELVYGNLDWERAMQTLQQAINVAFASVAIKRTKLALIGHQAPGFTDFHPNPFLLSTTFGTVFEHVGLTEYTMTALNSITEDEVEADVEHVITDLKLPCKDLETGFGVERADLPMASRHYLAMKKLIMDNNFDALSIRCWPELPGPQGLTQWCYFALARLATEGFPVACEGDVDGSLTCLVGKLLGCGPIYLSDWLEHDKHTLTLWHGGMAPFQLSEAVGTPLGPCISRHFNNRVAGCLDATIKIDIQVTVFRFWVMEGRYHLLTLEGRTIEPSRQLLGNSGSVLFGQEVDLVEGFESWVQRGFPHHVCVVEGTHSRKLKQFARDHGVVIV